MNKVPVRVDGRFRLGNVLGSGSYAVVYSAWNIINDDHVALKLETIVNHPSSVEREYHILKQLEGGIGIPCTLWFGRESVYHALVLELLGPSLHQLFLANG
ncbi:kinase-like domain-containing protein [Suillus subluteus]|nr:kinase-like domain-containing protein [Suillus subluteus]